MDTNIINLLLLQLAQAQKPAEQPTSSSLLVAGMIIAAIAPTLAAIAAYYQSRAAAANTLAAKETAQKTADTAQKTAAEVEKVHTAVNSERTATLALVSGLRDEILKMSKDNATLEERARGKEIAQEVATLALGPQAQAPVPVSIVDVSKPVPVAVVKNT